jgi:hypothetical protein
VTLADAFGGINSTAMTFNGQSAIITGAAGGIGMPVVLTTSQKDQIQGPLAQSLQKVLPDADKNCVKRIRHLWNVMLIAALGYYVGWWLPWLIFGYHALTSFRK